MIIVENKETCDCCRPVETKPEVEKDWLLGC